MPAPSCAKIIPAMVTRWKHAVAAAIILAQGVGIVLGRFSGESFWSWMPHDTVIDYELSVTVSGCELSPARIAERYGLHGASGRRFEPIADLLATISTFESRRPDESARVSVRFNVNNGPSEDWSWPPPSGD